MSKQFFVCLQHDHSTFVTKTHNSQLPIKHPYKFYDPINSFETFNTKRLPHN